MPKQAPFSPPNAAATGSEVETEAFSASPACVMAFNASDPSGASGLAADLAAIGSVGAHALPIVCGAYARDTSEVFDFFAFDESAIAEQARSVLEDITVQAIKVGFVGSPEALSTVAEIASDYADVPLIAYIPNLSWWQDHLIEPYLDACAELLLPQTTVLVGNHSTLWRWLLPDWSGQRNPTARDIAKAANEYGVAYTFVTGIPESDQHIGNTLASPQSVLCSEKFEHFEASFAGAGETLSAALTALIAAGENLQAAALEALSYLDHCLDAGFRPGMGQYVPDRMFWAQPEEDSEADDTGTDLQLPPYDTKH